MLSDFFFQLYNFGIPFVFCLLISSLQKEKSIVNKCIKENSLLGQDLNRLLLIYYLFIFPLNTHS